MTEVSELQRSLDTSIELSDFFQQLVDASEHSPRLVAALSQVVPWSSDVLGAAAEAFPVVRFVQKCLSTLGREPDPVKLAPLAFKLAYLRATELTLRGLDISSKERRTTRLAVRAGMAVPYTFDAVTLDSADQHALIKDGEFFLEQTLSALGLTESEVNNSVSATRRRFKAELRLLLAHADSAEQFAPLRRWLENRDLQAARVAALDEFAQLARYIFEQAPVFGSERFSVADVYVDLDCGQVRWSELHQDQDVPLRQDPFSDACGGRRASTDTILDILALPEREPIVIQGVAGAGKSTLSLRVASAILDAGLVPVRIRLRDLPSDGDLLEGIGHAVRKLALSHKDFPMPALESVDPAKLISYEILGEKAKLAGHALCKYVFILDGWDELTVSGSDTFQRRVERVLRRVREQLVDVYAAKVVVTGRPTHAIGEAGFLRKTTPLITLRPFSGDQLHAYVNKLAWTLETSGSNWQIRPAEYRALIQEYERSGHQRHEVLAHPLLAFVGIRVQALTGTDATEFFSDQTTVLRTLVDLTCSGAGKADGVELDLESAKIRGEQLRRTLRAVASAISVFGNEVIPHRELTRRLKSLDPVLESLGLVTETSDALTKLVISFYLRPGTEKGAVEFAHKSFREYLFAEDVVATIRAFRGDLRAMPEFDARSRRDFQRTDPRHSLSRQLSRRLCAPTSPEARQFIARLLLLNTEAAEASEHPAWIDCRDVLADIYDWWARDAASTPQESLSESGHDVVVPPLCSDLAAFRAPLPDRSAGQTANFDSTRDINAALGRNLFFITMSIHDALARVAVPGWRDPNSDVEIVARLPHKVARSKQSVVSTTKGEVVLFRPAHVTATPPPAEIVASVDIHDAWMRARRFQWCFLDSVRLGPSRLPIAVERCVLKASFVDGVFVRFQRVNLDGTTLRASRVSLDRVKGRVRLVCPVTAEIEVGDLDGEVSVIPAEFVDAFIGVHELSGGEALSLPEWRAMSARVARALDGEAVERVRARFDVMRARVRAIERDGSLDD